MESFRLAIASEAAQKFQEAVGHYCDAVLADPSLYCAHYNLALCHHRHTKNYEASRQHYERALEIKPEYADCHVNLGMLLKAQFSDFDGARKHLEFAIAADMKNVAAHYNLGLVLLKNFKEFPSAASHFQTALTLDPSFKKAQVGLKEAQQYLTQPSVVSAPSAPSAPSSSSAAIGQTDSVMESSLHTDLGDGHDSHLKPRAPSSNLTPVFHAPKAGNRDARQFSKEEVCLWLSELGFEQYIAAFNEARVCGRVLHQGLDDEDFKSLGVQRIHVKILRFEIEKLFSRLILPPHPRTPLLSWTIADVGRFLESIGMDQHCHTFRRHLVTGKVLAVMTPNMLSELGLALEIDRVVLLQSIKSIIESS